MLLMWAHTASGNRCPVCAYPLQCPERAGDQPEPSKLPKGASAKNKLESYRSPKDWLFWRKNSTPTNYVVGQSRWRSPCCRTRRLSIPLHQAERSNP